MDLWSFIALSGHEKERSTDLPGWAMGHRKVQNRELQLWKFPDRERILLVSDVGWLRESKNPTNKINVVIVAAGPHLATGGMDSR